MPAMMNTQLIVAGNIFLVGLMGAGKTTIGRQLAQQLGCPFLDSDQYLCDKTGVSIPTIFELEGEAGFRERERGVIDELTQMKSIVLATGGGAVLRPENRAVLTKRGTVVYLHVAPEILLERTRNDRNRPLLQVDNPLQKIQELYQVRDPIYRQVADIVLDIEQENHAVTFAKLQTQLLHYFK